jgi:hypothetical protein
MTKPTPITPDPIREHYDRIAATYRYYVMTPVINGVAYLDKYYPDWHLRVDVATFNAQYHNTSILSHIHDMEDFDTPEGRTWSLQSLYAHGFSYDRSSPYSPADFTVYWLNIIVTRLAGEKR